MYCQNRMTGGHQEFLQDKEALWQASSLMVEKTSVKIGGSGLGSRAALCLCFQYSGPLQHIFQEEQYSTL